MSVTTENNKRIARNTLLLYLRLLVTMSISLYSSRLVLQGLGIMDYGIYNVVTGLVIAFTFLNQTMAQSTLRYITFEIGTADEEKLKRVFNTSMQVHLILSVFIFVVIELFGVIFLNTRLVIPPQKLATANWVLQFGVIACMVNMLSVPYNALILSYEKMSVYACISMIESALKLLVALALFLPVGEKLILYSVLLCMATILIRLINGIYCSRNFAASRWSCKVDKPLLREMTSFASWGMLGNVAIVGYTQGLNIVLNLFFGPVVNAARGVAIQVQGALSQFSSSFQLAVNPQITKNYAQNELGEMYRLMCNSSKFSFYLVLLLVMPVILNTETILQLWLGNDVPPYTAVFCRIMLLTLLVDTLSNPFMIAANATGRVRHYFMVVSMILLSIVPISYLLLKCYEWAPVVFLVHLSVNLVLYIVLWVLLKSMIGFPVVYYLKNVVVRAILVLGVSFAVNSWLYSSETNGLRHLVWSSSISIVTTLAMICLIGLKRSELLVILQMILRKISPDKR